MADYTLETEDVRLLSVAVAMTEAGNFSIAELDRLNKLHAMFQEAQDQVAAGRSLLFSLSPPQT